MESKRERYEEKRRGEEAGEVSSRGQEKDTLKAEQRWRERYFFSGVDLYTP